MVRQPNPCLVRAREEQGLSQEKLAEVLGVTGITIGRWERGETQPSPYYRKKLCDFFGLPVQELGILAQKPDEKTSLQHAGIIAQNMHETGVRLQQNTVVLKTADEKIAPQQVVALSQDTAETVDRVRQNGAQSTHLRFIYKERNYGFSRKKLTIVFALTILFSSIMFFISPLHVSVTITDCDNLRVQAMRISADTAHIFTDELRQVEQRETSCTLPTGMWFINSNGYYGWLTLRVDYLGNWQGSLAFSDSNQGYMSGQWKLSQLRGVRTLEQGITQSYTGTLLGSSDTGFRLIGTFTESDLPGKVFSWQAFQIPRANDAN